MSFFSEVHYQQVFRLIHFYCLKEKVERDKRGENVRTEDRIKEHDECKIKAEAYSSGHIVKAVTAIMKLLA